jgi:hypothetical protein
MTSDNQWERITEGLGTEADPFWQHVDNPNAVSHDGGKTYYLIDEPTESSGSPRLYTPEARPVPHKDYPTSLEQAVFTALGTASVAWDENHVFDDVLARQAGEDLITWINEHYEMKEFKRA